STSVPSKSSRKAVRAGSMGGSGAARAEEAGDAIRDKAIHECVRDTPVHARSGPLRASVIDSASTNDLSPPPYVKAAAKLQILHIRGGVRVQAISAGRRRWRRRASFLHAEGVVASRSSRIRMQGECSRSPNAPRVSFVRACSCGSGCWRWAGCRAVGLQAIEAAAVSVPGVRG
ncbi:hypothetical protein, partial [Ralstonia pseudosolanacearum]|uniref:hypothetical protein n=2 Tax=Ralstonia pseudosolanacearum TaxID=1310165 RepID=UPI003221A232